jgi:hypothetical protein
MTPNGAPERVTLPRKSVALLLAVAAIALLSLVFGASYLETMLPGGLPVGNALTAIGLCAAAGAAIGLSAPRTAVWRLSVASLIGAAAWLPVSVALAGNLNLNFRGGHGDAWLALSIAIAVMVLSALIWALIARSHAK